MIHCHPKIQLLITFVHVTTFTFILFLFRKKKKEKEKEKNPKPNYGGQKLCLGVAKDHISPRSKTKF
jgi:hypothetical protein